MNEYGMSAGSKVCSGIEDGTYSSAAEHVSFVFLLGVDGEVHPLPHALYVALTKGEGAAPAFARQTMRVDCFYVRCIAGRPAAVVNETHALATFDAESRPDWQVTPAFHPHRDNEALASESASLTSSEERQRMLTLILGEGQGE